MIIKTERFPFVLTDENGTVLISYPLRTECAGNDYFRGFAPSDIRLIMCEETLCGTSRKIIVSKNGKAVIISMGLFPSARVILCVPTDIDYMIAISLVSCGAIDALSSQTEGNGVAASKYAKKAELAYAGISTVFSVIDGIISLLPL